MNKNWKDYTDDRGLIVQVGAYYPGSIDRGDTLQRNGFFELPFHSRALNSGNAGLLVNSAVRFGQRMAECKAGEGLYVRHPFPEVAHSSIWKTSRDQILSNIIAAGLLNNQIIVRSILLALAKRYFRYWNIMVDGEPNWKAEPKAWKLGTKFGDISGPEEFGVYIRALNFWPLYPFLLFLDIFQVLGSIVKVLDAFRLPSERDDVTRIARLYQSQKCMPTPLSWLARKIYKWFRPGYRVLRSTDGTERFIRDKNYLGAQYAMDRYFSPDCEPPFNELYVDLLKEF